MQAIKYNLCKLTIKHFHDLFFVEIIYQGNWRET
jgi:hypothetical protein